MTTTASPSVFIVSGFEKVPLIEQYFSWSLSAGVLPYTSSFLVPSGPLSDKLNSFNNPVSLEIEFSIAIGTSNFAKKKIRFDNLFLHDKKEHSVYEHFYKISDVRYLLKGSKAFVGRNMTRVRTEVGFLNPPPVSKNGNVSPASLRQPFDVFKLGRYVSSSVKVNGDPFTISEIIKELLLSLNVLPVNIIIDPFVLNQDGDYIVENVVVEGEDIYSSLSRILRMGRLNLGILKSGDLFIFSVDFFDKSGILNLVNIAGQQNLTTGPGRIYLQELKRIRPPKIKVLFERMNEVRISEEDVDIANINDTLNAEQSLRPISPIELVANAVINQGSIFSRRSIACVNIIKVPFVPVGLPFPLAVGQYFPISIYIEVVLGIPLQDVLRLWWNIGLERRIQVFVLKNNNDKSDALARIIAQAIRRDFRSLYQIDRFHLDRIKNWENKRAEVVDNFSGYRAPSPLWKDVTIFPRNRDVAVVRGKVLHQKNALSYRVDDFDPLRENPTAGTISIINKELGVFAVDFPPLSDSLVAEIVPSALEFDLINNAKASPAGDELLANIPLSTEHTMETLVSIVWNFDPQNNFDSRYSNDVDGKYFDLEYTYQDAEGPEIEFLSSMDYARFDVDGKIVNLSVLIAVSEAEAAKIFNQFIDRFVGVVKIPGIVQGFRVEGNLSNIIYSMSPGSGIETIFDLSQIPFDPEVIQMLPNSARAYLYRQLGKGGP